MSINNMTAGGRIPFDLHYTENKKEPSRNFIGFMISLRWRFKKSGEKYAQEDLLPCKAFGKTADLIYENYEKGNFISVTGEMRIDEDHKDKDEEPVPNYWVLYIDKLNFPEGNIPSKRNSNDEDDDDDEEDDEKPTKKKKSSGLKFGNKDNKDSKASKNKKTSIFGKNRKNGNKQNKKSGLL